MQAYIYSITPFDATVGTIVSYNWSGTQAQVNITIKDSTLRNTVYSNTVVTNLKQIAIPANAGSLQNGNTYTAYLTVTDSSGNKNDNRTSGVQFYCRATPTFEFNWTGSGTKLTNNIRYFNTFAFTFNIVYSQADGEKLNSWSISLYDADRVIMSSSGTIYNVTHTENVNGSVTANLAYQFSGFSDSGSYYIRAQGKTKNGITVDTGYTELSSNYTTKSIFSMLSAESIPDEGRIYVKSNIISASCKVYGPDGKEIPESRLGSQGLLYSGAYIDPSTNQITNGNHALILPTDYYMEIDEGFELGTFSNTFIFINPVVNKPLVSYRSSSSNDTVDLYYRVGKFNLTWQTGTPANGADVWVRFADTEHGGYTLGRTTYMSTDGWNTEDAVVSWAYPIDEDQACFELVVNGVVNDVYISNCITKPEQDERIGVVIVRDEGRYHIVAHNGFNLTDPKESYAASTNEDIG